ncbi:MAG: type II secretion system F family protein [Puniceicoccales bacterium]|jgi:type IV pilus assembly protein PilC|nr:type II secretion system F family protein [Puniceicoccales bacterium]
MRFLFKAVGANNELVSSDLEAKSRDEALFVLKSKNLRVISIFEESASPGKTSFLSSTWKKLSAKRQPPVQVTADIMLRLFEKLQKMVASGLTLSDSLSSVNKRTKNAAEKVLTSSLLTDILGGQSMSDAIKKFGAKIDGNVYSIILVGESSGNLATALADTVRLLKSTAEVKKKLKSSLIYPAFLTMLVFVVILVFTFFLMPQMENFIKTLGGEIPPMTKFLKSLTSVFIWLVPAVVIAAVVALTLIPKLRQTKVGRHKTDELILKIKPFSTIILLSMRANLSNLMGTLLANGINTSEALELAQSSIANMVLRKRFLDAKTDILDGKSVCASFEKHKIFDGEACDFLEVGEKIGNLGSSFEDIHNIYDANLKNTLRKVTIAASAIAMMTAFSLVGILALGMVQAIAGATSAAAA